MRFLPFSDSGSQGGRRVRANLCRVAMLRSWHPHHPTSVVKKTRPQSMFHKDAPFTKLQEKMYGLSALP